MGSKIGKKWGAPLAHGRLRAHPRSMVATHPRFASEGLALFRFLLGSATAQEACSAPIARLGSAPIQRPLWIPSPEPPRPPLPAVPPLPRARAVFPVTCHFCLPAGRPPVDHGRLRPTAPPPLPASRPRVARGRVPASHRWPARGWERMLLAPHPATLPVRGLCLLPLFSTSVC